MPNHSIRHKILPLLQEGKTINEVMASTGCSRESALKYARELFGPDYLIRPNHDWSIIQAYYDKGHSSAECIRHFDLHYATWTKAVKRGRLVLDPAKPPKKSGVARDMTGKRFGKLVVEKKIGSVKGGIQWICRCDCGTEVIAVSAKLNIGEKSSCPKCQVRPSGSKHFHWTGYEEICGSHWKAIQRGARTRELPFDLTIQQAWELFLKQGRKCAVSGEPIVLSTHRKGGQTASLDRIDPHRGYTLDNVQWVHKWVNVMKLDHTQKEFLDWVEKIWLHQQILK